MSPGRGLQQEVIIGLMPPPIDNITKFAWADEDYETIQRYVAVSEQQRATEALPS